MMIPTCQCKGAGTCPVFSREVTDEEVNHCQRTDEKGVRFRTNWAREAGLLEASPVVETVREEVVTLPPPSVKKILLRNELCAGDVLVSTAAIESVASQYPGRFQIGMDAMNNQPIYENNPHITAMKKDDPGVQVVKWEYPLIQMSQDRAVHFMEAYVSSLATALEVPITLSVNRPHLYLSEDEKGWLSQVHEITGKPTKYWLINAGFKDCFRTKAWLHEYYQEVVDGLRGRVLFVQIGQSEHNHKKLTGVIDLLDKTDLRQLIRLAYHAQGGIGPSTFLQHLMAAHEKPYVLVDSAREPASWMAYPHQTSMVKHGAMSCCLRGSCWRSRVVPLEDGRDGSMCEQPWWGGSMPVSRCISMIRPSDVIQAVDNYYLGGRLTY